MSQYKTFKPRLLDINHISNRPYLLIEKPVFKIGRRPDNDFVIEENTVSGSHAIIEQKQSGYFIIDKNSTNKTRVNGAVLDPNIPTQLFDGDEIHFDIFPFIFKIAQIEPPPPDPVQDDDETILFDSSTIIPRGETEEPPMAGPGQDDDETIFLDSGSMMDSVEETRVRPKPDSAVEKTTIGNYEIITLLGKGGFGSVWKARTKDDQHVAVKVLNPDILENDRAVRKFFHEAINLSKMNHPNICRFIDFFPHEGNYAIVMDFVEGTDLQDLLKNLKGPLPFDTARRIAAQTLDAFHYAHQKGVLHRDIKPENITLTMEGEAKVMDFGIAKLSSSESQQTALFMISPAYTAPERFDATKADLVDHRSDIYSLGLVFYEIFTGRHPFPTTNPMEMISAHLNRPPRPPHEIVDLPSRISDAILKALEKDPEDRFEDFAAFKMEMLGEAPLRVSQFMGPLEFFGESCKTSAALMKTLADILKKHQKKARKISVGQVGKQVELIIEDNGGNKIRITRNI